MQCQPDTVQAHFARASRWKKTETYSIGIQTIFFLSLSLVGDKRWLEFGVTLLFTSTRRGNPQTNPNHQLRSCLTFSFPLTGNRLEKQMAHWGGPDHGTFQVIGVLRTAKKPNPI